MKNTLSRCELEPFEQQNGEKMTEKQAIEMLLRLPVASPKEARQLADEIITLFLYDAGHSSLGEAWERASEDLPLTIDEWEEWEEECA